MPENQETELKTQVKAAPETAEAMAEPTLEESEVEQTAHIVSEVAVANEKTIESVSKSAKYKNKHKERHYNLHDTARTVSLVGSPLATFRQRFIALALDFLIVWTVVSVVATMVSLLPADYLHLRPGPVETTDSGHNLHVGGANVQVHLPGDPETDKMLEFLCAIFILIYFGLSVWWTNGLTLGKRIMGIRVASLTHEHITLWQSCERALGYGASALEVGFGFFQFFIYPNRTCVHDRIAETIVVKDRRGKKEKTM